MERKIYGYARVSTREQNEARQIAALKAFGVAPEAIFVEKQSGKDFERAQYQRLLRGLRPGDALVVTSIDRLGRKYDEILEQWRRITKEKQACIVVLDMPLLDTRRDNDLTGTLIADIVLQLLSYVAQMERDYIRRRQAEGIAEARKRGVRFGRRPLPRPETYEACLELWRRGRLSGREAARQVGVHHSTFMRWARERPDAPAQREGREG